ncbi:SOS response-associated peptidase [Noviherbaspirillum sp. Root189]|uniref:SOS response-associated peptidase n=1 Tax=Noviherbaspirillum sp. Root189 TaxID=1736487 RepID=UPI0009E77151|nr:SOS response-associated peptidase [Noviherbaspirillum sp. Root189]
MCGRITQHRSQVAYAHAMGWNVDDFGRHGGGSGRGPSWNVAPGTAPWLMHRFGDDGEHIDQVTWGYRPSWAAEKKIPIAINARIEKAATGPYFRSLWKSGRAIVPADGWYEWTGEKGHKQPWYIRRRDDRPMFLAAITGYRPEKEPGENTGFVIVTAAAEGGLVDVHDRRPVVFSAEDAALWMDNSLPPDQAEHLARAVALPPDVFEWYKVSTDVNRVGNNNAQLIEPIESDVATEEDDA